MQKLLSKISSASNPDISLCSGNLKLYLVVVFKCIFVFSIIPFDSLILYKLLFVNKIISRKVVSRSIDLRNKLDPNFSVIIIEPDIS